jgi:streptogramin lyase
MHSLITCLMRLSSLMVVMWLCACGGGGGGSGTTSPSINPASSTTWSGSVSVAGQPQANVTVTVYAAGDSRSAQPLWLMQTQTDGHGNYAFDAASVPAHDHRLIYVVAEWPATPLRLVSLMGMSCSSDPSCLFQRSVAVNELSSVAAMYSVAAYVSDPESLSVAGPIAGLTLSNGNFLSLVDPSSGAWAAALRSLSCGVQSASDANCTAVQKLNTLSNLLTQCAQATAQATNACQQWMQWGSHASHALSVLYQLISTPSLRNNGAGVFAIPRASASYSPELASAPADWSLALNLTGAGLSAPGPMAIDASGRVWISNGLAPYAISAFNNDGTPWSPSGGFTGNGLSGPQGLAVDAIGRIWVANWAQGSGSTLSIFNADGTAASGSPIASQQVNHVASVSGPMALALASNGNMWIANYGNSTLSQYSTASLSLAIAPVAGAGLSFPTHVATDPLGQVWLANSSDSSISQFDASGLPVSAHAYQPSGLNNPEALAVSPSGTVWVSNLFGSSLTELYGGHAPSATCDNATTTHATGCAMATIQPSGSVLRQPNGMAIDGLGQVWVVNRNNASLVGFDGNGSLISSTAGYSTSAMQSSSQVAIDAAGSIWVSNYNSNTLTKFIGLAAPVATPMQGAPNPM